MRVLLDGRIVLPRMTGAGRYVLEIGARMPALDPDVQLEIVLSPALRGTGAARTLAAAGARLWYSEARVASLHQWLAVPRLLDGVRPDLYHYPFLDLPYVQCPSVVTIYDLNPVSDRAYFAHWSAVKRLIARRLLRSSLRRCRVAVTISETTRRLLEAQFAEARGKTRTIPLALGSSLLVPGSRVAAAGNGGYSRGGERWDARPYILYVGVDKPHKNLVRLVRAFALFRDAEGWATGLGPYLWLAGVGDGSAALRAVLAESACGTDVRVSGDASEESVAAAYRGATIVAYVSTSEGFGLPILEGFAAGVPVLTGNVSSMPEVGGDAALYVSPEDSGAIAAGLKRLWLDGRLRQRLVASGTRRLRDFSWDATARATLAAYRDALQSAPA